MTIANRFLAATFASTFAVFIGVGGLGTALLAGATGSAHAAKGHEHSPVHGGIVTEANDLDFELVARPDFITLHIRDHGKPVSTQGASAKLTLLTGSERTEVTLLPAGADRLEAKGAFKLASGSKVAAAITLPGRKPANVRFALR